MGGVRRVEEKLKKVEGGELQCEACGFSAYDQRQQV